MPNSLIVPVSAALFFDREAPFSTRISPLSAAVRLAYDNVGALTLTSFVTGASAIERFRVEGTQGSLFSVTDVLTGVLFSVNDISGLPILTVQDTDTLIAGAFNTNTLIVSGTRVGIGVNIGTTKVTVSGSLSASGTVFASGGNSDQWNNSVTFLNSLSNSVVIEPNSTGITYRFQKFTDFLDGGETGSDNERVFVGDNGSVYEFRFKTTGARTGVDSTYSPPAVMEPCIGVRFIRTQSTIDNRGLLGLQRSSDLPATDNSSSQLYSTRCAFNSISDVVFRMGYNSGWTQDLWSSADTVGFEFDSSVSQSFSAMTGTAGGLISRVNTGIIPSISKCYIFSAELITTTSHRFRIWEQTAANTTPTSVYDQTLTNTAQNNWAYQIGIKTLAASEKILYMDWFLARYVNSVTAAANNIRFPFAI